MRFEWHDNPDIGYYRCYLYDDADNVMERISFNDNTCDFRQLIARENNYGDCYSFEVSWCDGWSMHQGFDYDSAKHETGEYQGKCTHTVDDVKRWCENWIAQLYFQDYYDTVSRLPKLKAEADWFESQGFSFEQELDTKGDRQGRREI